MLITWHVCFNTIKKHTIYFFPEPYRCITSSDNTNKALLPCANSHYPQNTEAGDTSNLTYSCVEEHEHNHQQHCWLTCRQHAADHWMAACTGWGEGCSWRVTQRTSSGPWMSLGTHVSWLGGLPRIKRDIFNWLKFHESIIVMTGDKMRSTKAAIKRLGAKLLL